ncbi:hypothetical protein GCM10009654_53750 [Streptomyces hebeiensis]|uniref:DUF4232 domain-containing protein n=1 Tax=Streptomyces hebeiensis TaxID=229486 RepID=A0ABN1V144_9ACTN
MSDRDQTSKTRSPGSAGTGRAGRGPARRAGRLTVAATLLTAALAACGSGGSGGSGGGSGGSGEAPPAATDATTTAPAATATTSGNGAPSGRPSAATSAPAPSATATAGATTATDRPGAVGGKSAAAARCTAENMGLRLGRPDVGAGNIRYDLVLVNKGPAACTLNGYPGVSLLAGDGAMIGEPATREGGRTGAVRLAPGATAVVTLHTLNKGIKGDSCWARPSLLKIYPPGSRDAMTLSTSEPVVCGDTFTVTAVRAG